VADFTNILLRSRVSFGFVDWQTSQSQQIIGTPELVPVPKKVIEIGGLFTASKLRKEKFAGD